MGQGPQKADHSGNFYMMPRRVTASVPWKHTSFRGRAILDAFLHAFNGHNNGEIAFAIHDIGRAIGSQNHSANAKAVAELIAKGFLEQTGDENRAMSKARTYRITFISTGKARAIEPATHDYEEWRPMQKRQFGGARTASKNPSGVAETASTVKVCLAETASDVTESRHFQGCPVGAETASPLYNHSMGEDGRSETVPQPLKLLPETSRADCTVEIDVLRSWLDEALERLGYGGARQLAERAKVPEPTLSRFRSGKNLPDRYHLPLQTACAMIVRYDEVVF